MASFKEILHEMNDLYERKNSDYGNSFTETVEEFGLIPAVARINDKLKRAKNIVMGQQMKVDDESLRDNLIDIANYCVLTIMAIDGKPKEARRRLSLKEMVNYTNDGV